MQPDKIASDISLYQNPEGLVLTTDAYLLFCYVRQNARQTVTELGAGSGLISQLLLVRGKCKSAVLVDVQEKMCDMARENARLNKIEEKVSVICADVCDYIPSVRTDIAVCNPPYLPKNIGPKNKNGADLICRRETTADIHDFAACASRSINFGGIAYFCYTPSRQAELFHAMLEADITPKECITVYPTVKHPPSLILVKGKKGASHGVVCRAPLIIYGEGGEYSAEFSAIYEEGRL